MAIKAKGTKLYVEEPTSTWVAVPGLKSFSPPNRSVGIINSSDHDSQAVEKQSDALPDNGQVTYGGNYDSENAVHQFFEDNIGETKNFRVEYNNQAGVAKTRHAFSAIIRDFGTAANHDGVLEFSMVLEVSGPITRSAIA